MLVSAAILLLFYSFWSLLPHRRRRRHGAAVGLSAAVIVAAAVAALTRQLISRTLGCGTVLGREIEIPIFLAVIRRRRHRGVLHRDPLLYRDRPPFCRRVERTHVAGADRVAAAVTAVTAGILAEVGVRRCRRRRRRVSLRLSSWAAPSTGHARSLGSRRSAPNAKSVFKNIYFAL